MDLIDKLTEEFNYINDYSHKAVTINSTARPGEEFLVLPRRYMGNTAIAGFLIDSHDLLLETLRFFDGKVDTIYVDVEQKKSINLFQVAKQTVQHSKLMSLKPNDMAVEACDLLMQYQFNDDIQNKNIIVIGTGNLASKIALRLSERQANVYMFGRSKQKEKNVIDGLNTFTPACTEPIRSFSDLPVDFKQADAIITFITGQFQEEATLLPYIGKQTLIVDGGINNFSGSFIQNMTANGITVTRLDVRLGLPYQFLPVSGYTGDFFNHIYGQGKMGGVTIVSGGFIGQAGSIIVDNLKRPSQVIGVADGMGGVKKNGELSEFDQQCAQTVRDALSVNM